MWLCVIFHCLSEANFIFRIGLLGTLSDEYMQLLRDSGIPPNDLMVFILLISVHVFVWVSLSVSWWNCVHYL